ncbi:MAG TPA: hypothetical protein VNO86_04045 [Candidatus Binatia bacterium]|nr:hypothetical protein [Candidatus Binatia bacterium]
MLHHDPKTLSDAALLKALDELNRRRPGAPLPKTGIRPRRRPWTYLEIRRLEVLEAEARRRGLRRVDDGPET